MARISEIPELQGGAYSSKPFLSIVVVIDGIKVTRRDDAHGAPQQHQVFANRHFYLGVYVTR